MTATVSLWRHLIFSQLNEACRRFLRQKRKAELDAAGHGIKGKLGLARIACRRLATTDERFRRLLEANALRGPGTSCHPGMEPSDSLRPSSHRPHHGFPRLGNGCTSPSANRGRLRTSVRKGHDGEKPPIAVVAVPGQRVAVRHKGLEPSRRPIARSALGRALGLPDLRRIDNAGSGDGPPLPALVPSGVALDDARTRTEHTGIERVVVADDFSARGSEIRIASGDKVAVKGTDIRRSARPAEWIAIGAAKAANNAMETKPYMARRRLTRVWVDDHEAADLQVACHSGSSHHQVNTLQMRRVELHATAGGPLLR